MHNMRSMPSRRDSTEEAVMDYDLRNFLELNAGSHHQLADFSRPRTMPDWNDAQAYHMAAEDSDCDGSPAYDYYRPTTRGNRSRLPRAAPPAPL